MNLKPAGFARSMPPKKTSQGRNGFYYFMLEIKQQHGRKYKSMREAAEAADPLWCNMSAKQKEPYETMARRERQHHKDEKYTSLGTSIAEVERDENALKNKEQQMRHDTQRTVETLMQADTAATHLFYIIHINNFCYSSQHKRNYPGEIAVSRFSLSDGINPDRVFHRLIHPGPLPLGYSYEAKKIADDTHQLPVPVGQDVPDNTEKVLLDLVAFLLEVSSDMHKYPPLYARERELAFITDVLRTIARDFAQDENIFNVYSLEYFLFVLKNGVAEKQVWPAPSLSADEIQRDVYDFTLDIACEYHRSIELPVYCSKAIVTRLGYIVCDNCCQYLEIDLVPGRHVPGNAELPVTSRANTVSSASSVVDDDESAAGYSSSCLIEDDRCNSTLSLVSADSVLDEENYPALGATRRRNTDSDTNSADWQSSRSSMGRWGRGRPVELPSALVNRMEGMSIQQPPRPKGRGRGIVKKPSAQ